MHRQNITLVGLWKSDLELKYLKFWVNIWPDLGIFSQKVRLSDLGQINLTTLSTLHYAICFSNFFMMIIDLIQLHFVKFLAWRWKFCQTNILLIRYGINLNLKEFQWFLFFFNMQCSLLKKKDFRADESLSLKEVLEYLDIHLKELKRKKKCILPIYQHYILY